MSEAEDRLKALFALDEPPTRDPAFVLQTTHLIRKRRLWLELLGGVPWVIATSAILWVAAPWLETMSRPAAVVLGGLVPAASLAAAALFFASPRSPLA